MTARHRHACQRLTLFIALSAVIMGVATTVDARNSRPQRWMIHARQAGAVSSPNGGGGGAATVSPATESPPAAASSPTANGNGGNGGGLLGTLSSVVAGNGGGGRTTNGSPAAADPLTTTSITSTTTSPTTTTSSTTTASTTARTTTNSASHSVGPTIVQVTQTSTVSGTINTSATSSSSASAAADSSASSTSGGLSRGTLIAIIIVASCVGAIAAIWTIIRKWKFSPSRRFEEKLNPIDFVDDYGNTVRFPDAMNGTAGTAGAALPALSRSGSHGSSTTHGGLKRNQSMGSNAGSQRGGGLAAMSEASYAHHAGAYSAYPPTGAWVPPPTASANSLVNPYDYDPAYASHPPYGNPSPRY